MGSRGATGGGATAAEDADKAAFPLLLRVVVMFTLLLLVVYTTLVTVRQKPAGSSRGAGLGAAALNLQADQSARRVAGLAQRVLTSAQGAAEMLQADPARPLDAAEAAVRLAGPSALGAAVVVNGEVIAVAGARAPSMGWAAWAAKHVSGGDWLDDGPAGGFGRLTLIAAATASGGPAPAPGAGSRLVLAADAAPALGAAPTGGAAAIISSQGRILAAAGQALNAADTGAALGLDPAQLHTAASGVAPTVAGALGVGRPAKLAVAELPDTGLFVVQAAPQVASSGATSPGLALQMAPLLVPLVIGTGLAIMLMVQTRRADRARAARYDSERKFRLAVEAARCGIWEWDLKTDQALMSDVTGVMLGWGGGGAARGEDVIGRIAPEHRDRVRQALRGGAAFGAVDVSFGVVRPAGGRSWIDVRGQAFGQPGPEGHTKLIGVAVDVTDERIAEHRAQSAERRLHDAIDSVSDAFVLWDRQGRLLLCNGPFRDFFSLEARVLKPGARRAAVLKLAELAVRTRASVANPARPGLYEVEMVDGRWLQVSERRTADGGVVMTATDITSIKRQDEARRLNEEALQNAVGRLEESRRELSELAQKYQVEKFRAESANSAKSEFLANMSHELRTPLNAINGFSEIMVGEMFGPIGDRRYRDYCKDILASGQHLLALINDILDMSKIEAGKMNLSFEPLDLADVVEDAVRLMRNRAESAGLGLQIDMAPHLPRIEADYRAIKQVLLNLLSNAVKFTPQGGLISVNVARSEAQPLQLHISVVDSGIGIAPEDLRRVGRPFEQIETQHSKTQQGTGLGLALTKALVELHAGVFSIESAPGVGTTVAFTLPLRQPAAPAEPVRRPVPA